MKRKFPTITTAAPVDRLKRIRALCAVFGFLLLMAALCFLVGKPLLAFAGDPVRFRAWVDGHGALGRLAFLGMMAAQIIIAFIPGEPLELAAGYAFGVLEGTGLCLLGSLIGGVLVFLFVRAWGIRAVEVFFPVEKINGLRFLRDHRQRDLLFAVLFFIPGTPKDVLTYFVGLTKMPLTTWLLITSVARLPSVLTSTVAGDALGLGKYVFAGIVFAATVLISLAGILVYRRVFGRKPAPSESAAVSAK